VRHSAATFKAIARTAHARAAGVIGRAERSRYTLLQLLGLALVGVAVGMVSLPLAVGLAGVVIFAVAYFLDADDGDDDDQPRS
jgi:hypothetical protein